MMRARSSRVVLLAVAALLVLVPAMALAAVPEPRYSGTIYSAAPVVNEHFGITVAVQADGDLVAVGAPDAGTGAAYLFSPDPLTGGLAYRSTATPVDGAGGDMYGFSVALRDNLLLVGAPEHNPGGAVEAGAVYVYTVDAATAVPTFRSKVVRGVPQANDLLGYSVATHGGRLVMGARQDDAGAPGFALAAAYDTGTNTVGAVCEASVPGIVLCACGGLGGVRWLGLCRF